MNPLKIVQDFSRRTGIKDAKVDTFLKLRHEGEHLDSLALSLTSPQKWDSYTVAVDPGTPNVDYDTVSFWYQKIKTEQVSWWRNYRKWMEADWEPHRRQRDFHNKSHHDADFGWVMFDEVKYTEEEIIDGEYRIIDKTLKELPEPKLFRAEVEGKFKD